MTIPPTYHYRELGSQAQMMSKNCSDERAAMMLQYVAFGSMIVMTGLAATQVSREAFGSPDRDRGRMK